MPAATSKRVLWKGAISFGLVHIPIALHSAVQSQSIDFDWLDRRTMDPVGYKRINKVTGEEIEREDIVKGIEHGDGEYVVLEADEIAAAYPRTTQTVEIEAFVSLDAVPFVYLERPYYVAPINKGGKVYALLREVLAESRLAGLAKVVIQTKQHLALLFACGPVLILNLLRWGDEVREWDALNLPGKDKKSLGLSNKELDMARRLVADMTMEWEPEQFTDSFREQIMQLVQEKIDAGETKQVTQPEADEEEPGTARIYDLTEMLQRSLKGRKSADAGASKGASGEQGAAKSKATSARAQGTSKTTARNTSESRAANTGATGRKTAKKTASVPSKSSGTDKTSAPRKATTSKSASSKSATSSKSASRKSATTKRSATKKKAA